MDRMCFEAVRKDIKTVPYYLRDTDTKQYGEVRVKLCDDMVNGEFRQYYEVWYYNSAYAKSPFKCSSMYKTSEWSVDEVLLDSNVHAFLSICTASTWDRINEFLAQFR